MPGKRWVNIKMVVPADGEEDTNYKHIKDFEYIIQGQPGEVVYGKMPVVKGEIEKLQKNPRILDVSDETFEARIPEDDDMHEDDEVATQTSMAPGVFIEDRPVQVHQLDVLYSKGLTGEGYTVGIPDSGITKDVREKLGNRLAGYHDLVGDTADTFARNNLHGSWTALAACTPQNRIFPIKVLNDTTGAGSGAIVAKAMDMCVEQGVDVICVSIGGSTRVQDIYQSVCLKANQHGIPVFCAAGNGGCQGDMDDVQSPGNSPNAQALVALDPYSLGVTYYSCCGPQVWMSWCGNQLRVDGVPKVMSGTSMTPWAAAQTFILLKQAKGYPPGPMDQSHMNEILTAMQRAAQDRVQYPPRNEGNGMGLAYAAYMNLGIEPPQTPDAHALDLDPPQQPGTPDLDEGEIRFEFIGDAGRDFSGFAMSLSLDFKGLPYFVGGRFEDDTTPVIYKCDMDLPVRIVFKYPDERGGRVSIRVASRNEVLVKVIDTDPKSGGSVEFPEPPKSRGSAQATVTRGGS